ncbi:MAG: redoxin domain-containing protein [Chloroflexi bacterium]|nr:redoxin domain-containing protein [Chloroflexota bacterium]
MTVDSDTVAVGSEAPDFTLEAIDGNKVTLSSLRGKPVVLVFLRGFH